MRERETKRVQTYVPVTMATLPARRAAFWDTMEDIYAIYIFFFSFRGCDLISVLHQSINK